ncbi:dnaJ homolog subfamily C member 1-like [Stegodyphus dumicola]|uniref:dnaJ homolog subfamily C member 1-like n=1 Tax=Stegodyphus dumicola TaxID=202533 RepID=UPI0015ABA532|nr:dnaJ homolog subfamily C member 1-like [Stegodyphus dumicola]
MTGTEKENFGFQLYEEKGLKQECGNGDLRYNNNNVIANGSATQNVAKQMSDESNTSSEKFWKQEEQRSLELALQKFPKDTPARWDKIADFVSTKTKEECVERYKILVQQIKKKKDKCV